MTVGPHYSDGTAREDQLPVSENHDNLGQFAEDGRLTAGARGAGGRFCDGRSSPSPSARQGFVVPKGPAIKFPKCRKQTTSHKRCNEKSKKAASTPSPCAEKKSSSAELTSTLRDRPRPKNTVVRRPHRSKERAKL